MAGLVPAISIGQAQRFSYRHERDKPGDGKARRAKLPRNWSAFGAWAM
jgi:hypothetical protein